MIRFLMAGSALALALATSTAANAAVVSQYIGADLTASPYTIDLGTGSLTFSTINPAFFAFDPTGVETSGSAEVLSLGPPFSPTPRPTTFFLDRGGSIGPGTLGVFAKYSTPAAIPFSLVDGLLGFRFTQDDGEHYGYVQVGGSFLTGFAYETVAGASVPLGPISAAAVPEPATWAMMIVGFGMTGYALRTTRRRSFGRLALASAA